MSLQSDLTIENVIAYSKACKEVSDYLCIHALEGRSTVVIPSRGAFPIYKTADHIREYERGVSHAHEWDIIPFTYDPCQKLNSEKVREYWVKVLLAESSGSRNDEWDFYQKGLAKLGREKRISPRGYGKFVMIDTVISGQASVEIIHSLERLNLDYQLILLADQNGEGIKPEYRKELERYSARVQLINVPNLYTEDRGPAMMGITTVLMPDLLPESTLMSTWQFPKGLAPDEGKVSGGGIRSVEEFFNNLHGMHFHASKIALGVRYGDDEREMRSFHDRLMVNMKWTKRGETARAFSEFEKYGDVEATSSMAVRIQANTERR